MKKLFLALMCIFAIVLTSCNSQHKTNETVTDSTATAPIDTVTVDSTQLADKLQKFRDRADGKTTVSTVKQ